MSHRIDKINKLIKQNISNIITRELSLKSGVFITIIKVDTSPDLRYAKVFVSIFPEKDTDYILETLKHEMYEIQGKLNRVLHMHPLPRIEFRVDKTEVEAEEIERLLKEI